MHLDSALTEFFYSRDLTPRSQEWYKVNLARFITFCNEHGVTDVEGIDAPLLRRYIAHFKETISPAIGKPVSSQTAHGFARAARAFVNFCEGEGWLTGNLFRRVKMPVKEQKVVRVYTNEELEKLLAACHDKSNLSLSARNKALISLFIDTGARMSEVLGLTLPDCHLTPEGAYILVNGKGRKQRELPLGQRSRKALLSYIHHWRPATDTPYVFLNRLGVKLDIKGMDVVLYTLKERAGLDIAVGAHRFRHTWACRASESGMDVYKISRLLGHTSVVVTEGYLRAFSSQAARQNTPSFLDKLS